MGLWFVVADKDVESITNVVYADADHAGDREISAKSTTGYVVGVGAPDSWSTLVWSLGKYQTSTARHTAEAECVAMSTAVFDAALPLMEIWQQLVNDDRGALAYIDNDAAKSAIISGESKKMAYLRKHQHISISSTHEFFAQDPDRRKLKRVESAKNTSDILTKPLDHKTHWNCVSGLGMGTLESPPEMSGVKDM